MDWRQASHSFEIKTAGQFLRKLEEDYRDFEAKPLSSRFAINCAMTAWHLREWVWAQQLKGNSGEQNRKFSRAFKDFKEFDAFLFDVCPEFHILQAICNGSKHFQVSGNVATTFSARVDLSASPRRFGRPEKGVAGLWVSIKDNKRLVKFHDVLGQILKFWQSKLQSEAYGWGVRPSSKPIGTGGFGRKPASDAKS